MRDLIFFCRMQNGKKWRSLLNVYKYTKNKPYFRVFFSVDQNSLFENKMV